jgi:hypothetical protein
MATILNKDPNDMRMRLCGQEVKVIYSDPKEWAPDGLGRSSTGIATITIKEGLTETVYQTVLIHEVIHYIVDTQGLANLPASDEPVVSTLANSLLAWMKDNPEIVKKIIGKKK